MLKKNGIKALPLVLSLLLFFGCGFVPTLGDPLSIGDTGGEKNGTDISTFTPTVFTEVTKDLFETDYYDQLSPNEKHVYDKVITLSPGECEVSLSFPEQPALCAGREPTEEETAALSANIGRWTANALYAVWLDHPEIFWLEYNAYSYSYKMESDDTGIVKLQSVTLELSPLPDITDAPALQAQLDAAIRDFNPPTHASAPEKVAYINNYLAKKIEYDLDAPLRGNIIGALVYGRCVCEGYAQAFTYLAALSGIKAVNIPGYATDNGKTEGHMWNGVFLNGLLYAVDSTWNDSAKRAEFLLVGSLTVCHGAPFGETHTPAMLTIDGPHKAFALPKIADHAYGTKEK